MGVHRVVTIAGLAGSLASCGLSVGGLDTPDIEPVRPDASSSEEPAIVDAADEPSTAVGAAAVDAAVVAPGCALSGTYALDLQADVAWDGTRLFGIVPIIVSGEGQVSVQTRIDIDDTPTHGVTVRACGVKLQDFQSILAEVYSASIPDDVWEKLSLRWNTRANFTCAQPGCAFHADPVVAQLGIGISPDAAWPSPRDVIPDDVQRDDDGDGKPGIRIVLRGPSPGTRYQYPPTNLLIQQRVTEIELAIRLAATLDGTLTSCSARDGQISNMTLELRALACTLESGMPCSDADLAFVDDNLPVWAVKTARFHAQKMPANVSCAELRQSLALIASP